MEEKIRGEEGVNGKGVGGGCFDDSEKSPVTLLAAMTPVCLPRLTVYTGASHPCSIKDAPSSKDDTQF